MATKLKPPVWLDAWSFRKDRADYYEYLSELMSLRTTGGKLSLREIFETDAVRHADTPRGRLSALWAERHDAAGGSLEEIFEGTLPASEVAMLQIGASGGGEALALTLKDLATNTKLVSTARSTLISTSLVGIVALAVVVVELFVAIPYLSVPYIENVFSEMVDTNRYGLAMSSLKGFAELVRSYSIFVFALLAGAVGLLVWSVPNYVGHFRKKLDKRSIWALYRDIESVKFLANLAAGTKKRRNVDALLRTAVVSQSQGASPWLRSHLMQVVELIDDGVKGVELFQTGLLSRDLEYLLDDMVRVFGLSNGVQEARKRLEDKTMKSIARRAKWLRASLMIVAVVSSLVIYVWHMAALYEMTDLMSV